MSPMFYYFMSLLNFAIGSFWVGVALSPLPIPGAGFTGLLFYFFGGVTLYLSKAGDKK